MNVKKRFYDRNLGSPETFVHNGRSIVENTDRTSIPSKWSNSIGEKENIAFERKNSKVYLDFIDSSKLMA